MIQGLSVILLLYLVALHCSIAAMEILSWLLVAGTVFYKLKTKSKFTFPLRYPLLGLALAVLISLITNPPIKPFWYQMGFMRWIVLLWGFYWALQVLWTPALEKKFLTLWTLLLPIVAANALFQFLTGVDLFHSKSHVEPQGTLWRATGFFSMSLTFAYVTGVSYFAVLLPSRGLRPKVYFWLVAISGPIALIASGARGAWLAAIACGFVYVGIALRRWLPHFIAAVMVLAVFLSYVSPKFNALMHLNLEWSSAVRLQIWRAYFEMFLDHPFNGTGIFHGDKLLPAYYARHGITEAFTSHAHNVLLQWLGGAGIFAFLCYSYLSVALLKAAWQLRNKIPWGWSLLLAQLFFHFGGLTEANFFDGEVNHFIVFVWALTLALNKGAK